jgi:hypothetical protein
LTPNAFLTEATVLNIRGNNLKLRQRLDASAELRITPGIPLSSESLGILPHADDPCPDVAKELEADGGH